MGRQPRSYAIRPHRTFSQLTCRPSSDRAQDHLTPSPRPSVGVRKQAKNWDALTSTILTSEKGETTEEDPNVGGDSTLNSFFQKIFGDADEDTKRAMMKSYQESGGTTLSTNWDEVKRAKVEVKPPAGSEWKK